MATAQFVQLGPFFVSGALQGGAKLSHYSAGTNVLKNIWSDRTEATPLAQPYIADGAGVFAFFADGLYKIVITDANDNVLYTWDNWQMIDPSVPTLAEGTIIPSASTITVGPEVWAHISGSTNISVISSTIPFFWGVFDGTLTLVHSSSLICPGSVNMSVSPGDVVFVLNDGSGVWRVAGRIAQTLLQQADSVQVNVTDTRTNTVDVPFTVTSQTTNTPSAGIGTGVLFQAESADEAPSDVGQVEFVTSDVTAGSEDSYFQILLRVAGAALAAAYRFVATTAFRAIFTHANTADRTYTLPDRDWNFFGGTVFRAPISCASGSTRTHEGSVTISANQNLDGVHFYTDFTLNSGVTITVQAGKRSVVIVATGTITINGTITATGAGGAGGSAGGVGGDGTDQVGGNGSSGGVGGLVLQHGISISTANTQLTASDLRGMLMNPALALGGAGGGGGSVGAGGSGGGSIVLIAPTVVLAATATLSTSGNVGGGGAGGGGGGGAGNIYINALSFTDNGATFNQTGGAGGGSPTGTAGRAGIKQINQY